MRFSPLPLSLLLALTCPAWAAPTAGEDEELLKAAGVPTDGPGLLAYLARCTPGPADAGRIRDLIRQLGADDFAGRQKASDELIALGPAALPALREAAEAKDLEIRRRARACLAAVESRHAPGLMAALVRRLAVLAPSGVAPALLAYLPAADEEVRPEVTRALWHVTRGAGKVDPAVVKALGDAHPLRRAAAALVAAGAGTAEERRAAGRLVTDPDPRVRLHLIRGMLLAKDKEGIPLLVETLSAKDPAVAAEAEGLLVALAGDSAPKVPLGSTPAGRGKCRRAWEAWQEAHADGVKLGDEATVLFADPARRAERLAGRFLAALLKGDKDAVRGMTALPFQMHTEQFDKAEQIDNWVGGVHSRSVEKKYTSRVTGKPLPFEKLPKAQRERLKKQYAGRSGRELYLVPVEATPAMGKPEPLFVVVRVVGGKAGVVGVGSPRP
jgi:hypothetical protein